MKSDKLFLLIFLFSIIFLLNFVIAAEDEDFNFDDLFEDNELLNNYEDEKLKQSAGTTPGDTFYFIDKFFDRFGDQLEVKEERIAEIKAMVEEGDLESAKIALEDYMELAEELEHEIDPERKEDA